MVENDHLPVMVEEVISYLDLKDGGYYLDGTIGLGGHAISILRHKQGKINLLGIDQDKKSIEIAKKRIKEAGFEDRVILENAKFSEFSIIMKKLGWSGLDGALLDLGISSFQLADPDKGLSFIRDFPLDMRLNPAFSPISAKDVVNSYDYRKIKEIIKRYGEDPFASKIAKAIVRYREKKRIETTAELAKIVESAYPVKVRERSKNHPATRTFQALRIYVNNELKELENFLKQIPFFLNPKGRVVIISFHSLEDRLVKRFFRYFEKEDKKLMEKGLRFEVLTPKPIVPKEDEIKRNIRSRSAKMRVAEVVNL